MRLTNYFWTLLTAAMVLVAAFHCECAVARNPSSSAITSVCSCCEQKTSQHKFPAHAVVCSRCSGTLIVERLASPDLRPVLAQLIFLAPSRPPPPARV